MRVSGGAGALGLWLGFKEEYTFPVLMDQGYVSEQGVTAFPTTWFVDPHGKICFEKKGWSEELAQEFAWRVEALRGR